MKITSINFKEMQEKILKKDGDIFIQYNDTHTIKELLKIAYKNGYNDVGGDNFNIELDTTEFKAHFENIFYKCFHGNSKPILSLYYNHLNNKYEIQWGTHSVYASYPHLKNRLIYFVV